MNYFSTILTLIAQIFLLPGFGWVTHGFWSWSCPSGSCWIEWSLSFPPAQGWRIRTSVKQMGSSASH